MLDLYYVCMCMRSVVDPLRIFVIVNAWCDMWGSVWPCACVSIRCQSFSRRYSMGEKSINCNQIYISDPKGTGPWNLKCWHFCGWKFLNCQPGKQKQLRGFQCLNRKGSVPWVKVPKSLTCIMIDWDDLTRFNHKVQWSQSANHKDR